DELLRLGEGAIDDGALLAAELHPRPLLARGEPLGGEEDAGLDELLIVLLHRGERFRLRNFPRFGSLRRPADEHETQRPLLDWVRAGRRALHGLTDTSNETGQTRQGL